MTILLLLSLLLFSLLFLLLLLLFEVISYLLFFVCCECTTQKASTLTEKLSGVLRNIQRTLPSNLCQKDNQEQRTCMLFLHTIAKTLRFIRWMTWNQSHFIDAMVTMFSCSCRVWCLIVQFFCISFCERYFYLSFCPLLPASTHCWLLRLVCLFCLLRNCDICW